MSVSQIRFRDGGKARVISQLCELPATLMGFELPYAFSPRKHAHASWSLTVTYFEGSTRDHRWSRLRSLVSFAAYRLHLRFVKMLARRWDREFDRRELGLTEEMGLTQEGRAVNNLLAAWPI